MSTKNQKKRKEKRGMTNEFDLYDIYKLQIIEREMPQLLTVKQEKYLKEFENKNQSLNQLLSKSRQELVNKVTKIKLQPHRNLREVKFLFKTGNPKEVINLIQNEINWLQKPIMFPIFIERTKIDEMLFSPRYKNDPIKKGGYYALYIKERRKDVIRWWENLLRLTEILTDDAYSSLEREVRTKTASLIKRLDYLFPKSQPWKKIEKVDKDTLITLKDHLYTCVLKYAKENYSQISIKTGTANQVRWHKIEQIDKQFETMISTFLQQYELPSKALSIILDDATSSITILRIVELIIQSKYDISEKTVKRKSKKKNPPNIKQSSMQNS